MKKNFEIVDYLHKQPWFSKFVANIESTMPKNVKTRLLNGEMGAYTIVGAFEPEFTPQGKNFWTNRNNEFVQWFNK